MFLLVPAGQHAVLNKHDSSAVKTNYAMHIAHATAMIAAFAVLMPLAGLVARHRWIFTPVNQVGVFVCSLPELS
jgi:hypothetical protein